MTFYQENVLPHLINCACGMRAIQKQRAKVVPLAHGRVLEVGMGSGLNLPFYDTQKVTEVIGLEPSPGMHKKAEHNLAKSSVPVQWLEAGCEKIPIESETIDSVVLTYTLCTVVDPEMALKEIYRVLRPEGRIYFSEHGQAPDSSVQKWQDRINPVWKKLAGGCNLNRNIAELIAAAGFQLVALENAYVKGPKIATYQYWGVAEKQLSVATL